METLEHNQSRTETKLDSIIESLAEIKSEFKADLSEVKAELSIMDRHRTGSDTIQREVIQSLADVKAQLQVIAKRREVWALALAGIIGTAVGGLIVAATTGLVASKFFPTAPNPQPQVQHK